MTPGLAQAAGDSLIRLHALSVNARYATADNLSNIYLIAADNAIEKYSSDGRLLTRYTNKRLGQAASIDVSNPLKVLVWYPDFRMAVFLDRSLTVLGELNLISAGYPEVRSLAAARDGNIWIYDEVRFRLLKITPEGEKRFESQDLTLLEPTPRFVSCIRENNDHVYLADSTQGVFVFDVFAQFDRLFVPLYSAKDFVIADDQIHYLAGHRIIAERLSVRASRETGIPTELLQKSITCLAPNRLLVLKENLIEIYKY
ncbi:MAG: hypothetical protein IPJ82_08420 [Lewinellaceae bacterium]|nr:hypothetical protein [Lewinellaceae bacterium]